MARSVRRTRLLLLLLLVQAVLFSLALGILLGFTEAIKVFDRYSNQSGLFTIYAPFAFLVLVVVSSWILACWPAMARNARLGVLRAVAFAALCCVGAIMAGAKLEAASRPTFFTADNFDEVHRVHRELGSVAVRSACMWLVLAPGIAWLAAIGGQPKLPMPPATFFLWERRHVAGLQARKYLAAAMVFSGLVAGFLVVILPEDATKHTDLSVSEALAARWSRLGMGLAVGSAIVFLQGHWHRAVGFVSCSFMLLCVAFAAGTFWPGSIWPLGLVGAAIPLAMIPLVVGLLAVVPPRQQFVAMLVQHAAAALGAVALSALFYLLARSMFAASLSAFLCVVTVLATAAITRALFRSFIETINEIVFRPMWWPRAYGPGAFSLPTRGPALVIGNHAAMVDPVWVQGVVPLALRAMMLSTVFDKPILKWLCGRIYGAIRVPAEGFRRTAPEIEEAIAALRQGDPVMIFPEGWLRRKEEQPLRRFAQGVWRILSQCPETPVISCWIEEGWGSWTSWKDGPPIKGKRLDTLKRVHISFNEPEIVPAEILKDDIATRRYLMERVLHARTHLGLPAYPMPAFGEGEKEDNKEGNHETHEKI